MMGQLPAAQNTLFHDFNLEQHIPPDHLLPQNNQFLDFDTIRTHLKSFYSHTAGSMSGARYLARRASGA